MPRQVRLEYEGTRYHVMARGNRHCCSLFSPDETEAASFRYPRACAGGTQAHGTGKVPAHKVACKKRKSPRQLERRGKLFEAGAADRVLEQRFEALHFPDKAQLPKPLSRSNPHSVAFPFRTNPRKS